MGTSSRANASQKSSRQSNKRQQSRAKAQESNTKDKVIEQLNKILGDYGWDHEIVHSLKMEHLELLSMELTSNK